MNKTRMIIFPLVVLLQMAVLGSMIWKQETILSTGEKVLLRCGPVDPRSLFSGDYVILNYEITRPDYSRLEKKPGEVLPYGKDRVIYLALEKPADSKLWKAAAISQDLNWLRTRWQTVIMGRTSQYGRIRFGLESYFVPQNEGKIIEQDLKNVYVEVSITGDGSSAISRLFLNDKEVKFY